MTYASATKTYTTTGAGLISGVPGIGAKDPKNAKITFDGKSYEVAARSTHSLPYGTTEWEIIVQNMLEYRNLQADTKQCGRPPLQRRRQFQCQPRH